tara:strand:- start:1234 stop:1446 length:213 start_codon:yes stop_codon:yes gene_type:complete
MKKYILNTIVLFFFLISNAYAYLDPGSGSIILQAILGFIAASLATISFYWSKLKIFLNKLFKKNKKSERD